jgi:DNA polymerase elongation subunit (family B)
VSHEVVDWKIVYSKGFEFYEPTQRKFIEFHLSHCEDVNSAAGFLEKQDVGHVDETMRGVYGVNKCGVDYFLLEGKLSSFDWISYEAMENSPENSPAEVRFSSIVKLDAEGRAHPNYLQMFIDIETISPKYQNSQSKLASYPIGLISYGTGKPRPTMVSLMLKSDHVLEDESIEHTLFFDQERDMLEYFMKDVLRINPKYLSGYNSDKFDFKYIFTRAKLLGVKGFEFWSRLKDQPVLFFEDIVTTNQAGAKSRMLVDCPGRIFLDYYPVASKNFKLDNYRLNTVAEELHLGQKMDVSTEQIYPFFHESRETRKLLCEYNQKDVELCVLMEGVMCTVPKLIEDSLIYRCRAKDVVYRGVAYLVFMMIKTWMIVDGFRMIFHADSKTTLSPGLDSIRGYRALWDDAMKHKKYQGVFVFPSKFELLDS